MDDLLKDAIADAKAVRETALVNAKLALEEAFTPKIQSMLSKKIQSETEGETEEGEEVPAEEEEMEAEEGEMEAEEEEVPAEEEEEVPAEEPAVDAGGEEGGEDAAEKEVDVDVEDDDDDEEEVEDDMEAEEGGYEEDLDLEAIIRELEGEETEEEEVPAEEEEDEIEENNDASSEIGNGDNKNPSNKSSDDNTDDPQGTGLKTDTMGENLDIEITEEEEAEESEEVDENIDLEEILKSLSEEEETEEDEEEVAEVAQLKSDLGEHRKVIKFLRSKLNEVNLLNAKLLFTNKLFKAFNLNNDEKLKVVETFDRANNLREAKLVYSTLAESFGYGSGISRKKVAKPISEGASKPVGSTKPKSKEIISEGNDLSARFKKLANIKG